MKHSKVTIVLTLIVVLLSSSHLFADDHMINAQTDKDIALLHSIVQQELNDGKPQQAYDRLMVAYRDGKYDNQTLFFLGLTAKQLEKYDESEKYLKELINKDPDAPKVKLELAEVVYRNGDPKEAKRLLAEVKASNPPKRVGENIDAFLAFIENGQPKAFSANVSLGVLYDTNANQGPRSDTITLYDLPFTLSSDALPSNDWAETLMVGINYTQSLTEQTYLQAELGLNHQNYLSLNTFDYSGVSFSFGPSFRQRKWVFSVPYVFNIVRFGHDQDYYYLINGVAPQFGYQVSNNLMLSGSVTYAWKNFLSDIDRNSEVLGITPSMRLKIGKNSLLTLGSYYGHERADVETYSNDSWGVNGSFSYSFNENLSASISPSYLNTTYKGEEVMFHKTRKDEHIPITTNIDYLIGPIKTNLTLSYTWTNNNSSIDLYKYNRQQTTLTLSKSF